MDRMKGIQMPRGNSDWLLKNRRLAKPLLLLVVLFFGGLYGLDVCSQSRLAHAQEKNDKVGKSKPLTNQELVFFETKIRPVLANNCYACHSEQAGKSEGGLRLDTREGMLSGGDSGALFAAGNADKSLLLKRIGATNPDLQMPPKGHGKKLSAAVVKDFSLWVRIGAPDPRTKKKSGKGSESGGESKAKSRQSGAGDAGSGQSVDEEAKIASARTKESEDEEAYRSVLESDWWSYKPLVRTDAPRSEVKDADASSGAWGWTAIDRYVEAGYRLKGISPVTDASPGVLFRRLH